MKDILTEYYDKYYGNKRLNTSRNATLLTEATKPITNASVKTRNNALNCIKRDRGATYNSHHNQLNVLPLIGYNTTTTASNEVMKDTVKHPSVKADNKTITIGSSKVRQFRNKRFKFSLDEEQSIKDEAMRKVQQLLEDHSNDKDNDNSNGNDLNDNGDDIFNNKNYKGKYLKEDQVDKLFYIKENIKLEPNNLDLLKSKKAQLSKYIISSLTIIECFHDENYRINLINGVHNYEAKCLKYQPLKNPLLGRNRFVAEPISPEPALSKVYQSFKLSNLNTITNNKKPNTKTKTLSDLNIETLEEDSSLRLLRGIDTRMKYNLDKANNIYNKINQNRKLLRSQKKEIYGLIYK